MFTTGSVINLCAASCVPIYTYLVGDFEILFSHTLAHTYTTILRCCLSRLCAIIEDRFDFVSLYFLQTILQIRTDNSANPHRPF